MHFGAHIAEVDQHLTLERRNFGTPRSRAVVGFAGGARKVRSRALPPYLDGCKQQARGPITRKG